MVSSMASGVGISIGRRDLHVRGAIGARSKGWTKKKSNEREYDKKRQDLG